MSRGSSDHFTILRERERFMYRALCLAARGRGLASPNPMVGAVVVANSQVVGEGYHRGPGTPHAEIVALAQAAERAQGACLYVTLEPCNHFGRTPPCVPEVIAAGVRRVVIASPDPNPRVAGGGIEQLREAGIEVEVGTLREHENRLNEAYRKYVTTGRPFVTLKIAMSLDGKIATRTGQSRWITGKRAQVLVHRLRREHDAVLVGVQTVIADDPELTVRHVRAHRQPLRVVTDSSARTPPQARLLRSSDRPALIAVTDRAPEAKCRALREAGAEVIVVPQHNARVDLVRLLEELGRREVAGVLAEAGGELAGSLIERNLADKLVVLIAPRIIGGAEARTAVGGVGVAEVEQAWPVRESRCRRIGDDFVIEGYLAGKGVTTESTENTEL